MKIPSIATLIVAILLIIACGQTNNNGAASNNTSTLNNANTSAEKTFAASAVNNKKDPSCGMPVTAGISDTAHYEKWVIGFCSTECKNEFLKNPKANLAAAEIP